MTTKKRCKGPCGLSLPFEDFHYKNKVRGTRQARCKACMSEYGKQHYEDNREIYIDRAKERLTLLRAENAQAVKDHISTHPCVSCGEADPRCLKVSIDSEEILNRSPEVILSLLSSRQVLCLNCRAKL